MDHGKTYRSNMPGMIVQWAGDTKAGSMNRKPMRAGAGSATINPSVKILGVRIAASNADLRNPLDRLQIK